MSIPPFPIDPNIVPYTALPIYIPSYDCVFLPPTSGTILWSTAGANPGLVYNERVWVIQNVGQFTPTPVVTSCHSPCPPLPQTYRIVHNFNKVPTPPHLLVQFSGPLTGTFQYRGQTLDASTYVTYTFFKKVLTLIVTPPDNTSSKFFLTVNILDVPPVAPLPKSIRSNLSLLSGVTTALDATTATATKSTTSSGTENIVLTNNTSLFFYYLFSQTSGGCSISNTLAANSDFFNTYNQILFPGQSVTVTCTVNVDPYYGFVTFNAYPSYNDVSIGVFNGQVQFEYSGGDPTTMAPNYLNGYLNNNSNCPQIGTLTGSSTGFNPFFSCSAVNSSNVLNINANTAPYNIGLSSAFTNQLTWTNVWEVPSALATTLSSVPGLTLSEGILSANGSPIELQGCSLSGNEFNQAPTLYEGFNSNQLSAVANVKSGINCIRIPVNAVNVIASTTDGSTYAPLDLVTTSIISTVTGTAIQASASQLQLLDTIIYNAVLSGIPYIVIDLHSTDPISDLSNAVYSSGYNGAGWPGGSSGQAYGAYGAQSPMASNQLGLDFWTLFSTKYAGYTNIIFEAFNEPQLIQCPNSANVCELLFWYYSSSSPVTLSQNVSGGSYLSSTISQTVAGFQEIVSTIQANASTNIILISGTAFNANYYFLQNPDYAEWLTWLTTTPNLAIGYHFYAQQGTYNGADAPGYLGIPVSTSSGAVSFYTPPFDASSTSTYAPFGSPLVVSSSTTSALGWIDAFQFLMDAPYNMCLISTESGTNFNISAVYGGDYLAYLYQYSLTFSTGQIHILPWAFYANTLCYPSLIENFYYWNNSSSSACAIAADPTQVASNLIGTATTTTEGSCTATTASPTANGTFPGYGIYWSNPSSYPN